MDNQVDPPRGATAVNDELEVGFDARFEAAWNRLERIGRWAMLAIVLAGLAGLLGAGPLDHRRVQVGGDVFVDYQPIARFGTATQITLHLPPDPTGHGTTVRFSSTFFEPLGVRGMLPRAASETAVDGGTEAVFLGGGSDALVRLDGKPSRIGVIPLVVTIGDAVAVHLSVFVLP